MVTRIRPWSRQVSQKLKKKNNRGRGRGYDPVIPYRKCEAGMFLYMFLHIPSLV